MIKLLDTDVLEYHCEATSFSRSATKAPFAQRRLYVTLVEDNSLVGGANSFTTPHPPPKVVPLPPLGKA